VSNFFFHLLVNLFIQLYHKFYLIEIQLGLFKMSKKTFIILCLLIFLFLNYSFALITVNFKNKMVIQKELSLKSSGYWVLGSIIIDNSGGGDYTWSEAAAEDWCSGSGTWNDPFVIENVTINANFIGRALLIRYSDVYFRIENCHFYNTGNVPNPIPEFAGITLDYVDNGFLINNNCSFNTNAGIYLRNSNNNTIKGNSLNNNNYGIKIYQSYSTPNSILDNSLENNDIGICIYYSSNILAFNNSVCNNQEYGLYSYISFNNTYVDNCFSDNRGEGIELFTTSFNNFSDNEINNNRENGIYLSGGKSNNNTFFNNQIKYNEFTGLFITANVKDSLIYGNFFLNNGDNAYDNGIDNSWDNGSFGNCWDDYSGSGPYNISGSAQSQDNYPMFNNYNIPGDIGTIPSNQTIKIGLLEDLNDISGSSAWEGAYLAAKEINEVGGISINGTVYYLGLISENTFEQELNLDITKGINSANNLITNYKPDFVIGGSNYFATSAYLEPIMDAKIPFINTGVFNANFSQKILDNYTHYKYLFNKVNNNSRIEDELITYQNYLANYLSANLSRSINKIAFLSDKTYLVPQLIEGMKTSLSSYGIETVKEITYSYTTTKDDFTDYWNEIDNAGAQLTFVIGFTDNVKLISETYGEVKPRCLLLNYNKFNPHVTYWDDSNEGCEYEIAYQATFNTSRTFRSIIFWNQYVNEYHHDPYFWSASAYDAIYLIKNVTSDSQSFNASKIIKSLEKINISNSFPGIHGKIAFTNSHGLYNGLDYPSGMICQWQTGGNKVVLPNNNLIYSDTLATGNLQIPDWGINIHFTINSPNDNNIFEEMAPVFNIEILDVVDKIWYTLNSGSEKYFINNNGTIDQTTWEDQLSDGLVRITFYSNDTSGHIYRRYVDVIRDTLPPLVTIEPMDTTTFGSEAPTIVLNIQDATNITESYYSLDGGVTKIPFTGNAVTINQTLWDALGEGLVTIAFYIIDALDKETIVYVDVYKELPGEENFLLYIIIGIIALGLGVASTIVYTQYRKKKRRRTEWIKLKKKKGLISPELAEGKNLIFISYATNDLDLFQIPLITDILVQYPEIDDILYWESDMHDDIYEYMDDNLKLCSVFLLFCSQNSLYSEPVKTEWRSALKLDKKVIPIFINPNDIPPLLTTKLGVQFKESEVYESIEQIYQMILKKLEISSTREFCRYLIPKLVSDDYFEEQTAPMVKKDIEIESDIPIKDLQLQLISILEKNNFQLLAKPIKSLGIEKSEEFSRRLDDNNLINLRFFAEDKFQKQEIGLSIAIQKGEDDQNKVYLRIMGNKEWMVNEIISDLNTKCYRLKTVKELLRDYLDKIEEFIDHLDNLEQFLRKNFGAEIEEIEALMYQYLGKQIEKDVFIRKAIQLLGKQFLLPFIENLLVLSQDTKKIEEKDEIKLI